MICDSIIYHMRQNRQTKHNNRRYCTIHLLFLNYNNTAKTANQLLDWKYLQCNLVMVRRCIAAVGISGSRTWCRILVYINTGRSRDLLWHVCVAGAVMGHAKTHPLKWLINCNNENTAVNNYTKFQTIHNQHTLLWYYGGLSHNSDIIGFGLEQALRYRSSSHHWYWTRMYRQYILNTTALHGPKNHSPACLAHCFLGLACFLSKIFMSSPFQASQS